MSDAKNCKELTVTWIEREVWGVTEVSESLRGRFGRAAVQQPAAPARDGNALRYVDFNVTEEVCFRWRARCQA